MLFYFVIILLNSIEIIQFDIKKGDKICRQSLLNLLTPKYYLANPTPTVLLFISSIMIKAPLPGFASKLSVKT